ncbi:MAG: sulfur oxidation c-type cytochrome SoxA [Roseiarcus sp.]
MRALAAAILGALAIAATAASADDKMAGIPAPPGSPFKTLYSGYQYRSADTRAMQDDDIANPGFLAIDRAAAEWKTPEGGAGKSCFSCHAEAAKSMRGVGAEMPKWSQALGKPINLEQQIDRCRTLYMSAPAWSFGSEALTDMTTYVRYQSRGMPVDPRIDGPMSQWFERGKQIYYDRVGQLDLSCASCHEENAGKHMRADLLSQGQTNGFPTYRLRDQRLIPLHERFQGCMHDVRAIPYAPLSDEFLALELYVAWRGIGLPVETPAVRN